jgi:hypothetical protein
MPNGNMMAGMPPGIPMGGPAPPPNTLAKPGGQQFSVADHVQTNWDQAQAQHKQLMAAAKRMSVAKNMLDKLKKMGDQVQVEDVIEGAGTMVGAGFSPQALAQLLAQMPTTGGEALQAWVEQQDQRAQQMDIQLQQKMKAAVVHKGITAMAALHVDHIKGQHQVMAGIQRIPAMTGGNALASPGPAQNAGPAGMTETDEDEGG